MVSSDSTGDSAVRTASQFATTHWSVVLAAADSASPNVHEALEALCRTYWYPLYAFVRLKGYSPEDAKDLTQAFFERVLQKHALQSAAAEKGRFRSFLLTALQHFLCDQFDRSMAAKRGGGVPVFSLDIPEAEALLSQAAASHQSPESIYDRAWAEAVVQNSMEQLQARYATEARAALFRELRPYLSRPAGEQGYSATAQQLGLSPNAVAASVSRLRQEYRAIVRAEVANTVATPAEIDDEMRYLVNLLTS